MPWAWYHLNRREEMRFFLPWFTKRGRLLVAPWLRSLHWYGFNPYGADAGDWAEYRRAIVAWADAVLKSYTYQRSWGAWEGTAEPCVILTHIGKPVNETHLLELKDATNQYCILVTESQVKVRKI